MFIFKGFYKRLSCLMHFKAKGNVDEGEIWYVTEVVRQTMIIDNYLIIRHW